MLRLLRQISYRQLRASWGRTLLVVGGIATGVALIVAINVINTSVLANFTRTIELIAGPAQLEVTLGVGEVGFPEETVELVRRDPDVVAAVPLVRGTVALADAPGETLQLFGVDLTAEEELERYQVRAVTDRRELVRILEDQRAVLVATAFAARHGLAVGESIDLATPAGIDAFTVRGLLEPAGLATAFGGQLAVMDLAIAQRVLAKLGRVDQIDIVLLEGRDVESAQQRLQAALPATLSVRRPEQRGKQYDQILSAFQAMLTGLSTLCLIAGVFIIYNTTSTGALRRAAVMGGLRLIGAHTSSLFRLLMLEALVLGTLGTALGIVSGMMLAYALTAMVADSMGVIFQLRFPVQSVAIDASHQMVIVGVGVGSALFASYFAARRASQVEPLEIIRPPTETQAPPPRLGRLVVWWATMVVISGAALVLQKRLHSFAWGNFGSTLWNASVLVIAVPVVTWARVPTLRVLPRLSRAAGRVAADSLVRSCTRTGVTVAAVALVLTLAITLAGLALSFRRSVSSYSEEGGFLTGDLVVSAVATQGGWLEIPLPEDTEAMLQHIPGVQRVETWRALFGQVYGGQRIALLGLSDGFLEASRYGQRWYVEGEAASAAEAVRGGRAVNVSATLADRFDLHPGARISLDTPTGPLDVPVAGVVRDYLSDAGTIVLSRRLIADRWREPAISRLHVFLTPDVSPEDVRRRVTESLGSKYALKILSLRETIAYQAGAIDRAFAFTGAIQLLIGIVTIAGILDLLLGAIVERRRELALWRIMGADEATVRRSVVIQSATIGSFAIVLGLMVAVITTWIWVGFNFRYLLGYALEYHFPYRATLWYVALVLATTALAGYVAASEATRQSVLQNIKVE